MRLSRRLARGVASFGPDLRSLPSGTTLRFVLLLLTMVVASVAMLDTMLTPAATSQAARECWIAGGLNPQGTQWSNYLALRKLAVFCPGAMSTGLPDVPYWRGLIGTGVLLFVAVVYWVLPRRRERGSRLLDVAEAEQLYPHQPDEARALRAELAELVAMAGLRSPPRFVVDRTATASSAVVFGRPRRRVVCLYLGLLPLRAARPEYFRSVVLHELSHLRNGDVDIARAVVALWHVFLVAVLLRVVSDLGPVLLASAQGRYTGADAALRDLTLPSALWGHAQLVFLVGMVGLARADTLRHREFFADADAVAVAERHRLHRVRGVWEAAVSEDAGRGPQRRDGTGTAYRRLRLASAGLGVWRGAIRWLSTAWSPHPSWRQRLNALDRPVALFTLNAPQVALIGAAAMIAAHTLGLPWLPWAAVAPAASILSVAAWRALFYRAHLDSAPLARDAGPLHRRGRAAHARPSGLRSGAWLGLGLVAGHLLGNKIGTRDWLPAHPVLLLVLFGAAVAYMAWVTQCADLLQRRGVRPAWGMVLSSLTATGLAVAGLQWWNMVAWFMADGFAQPLLDAFKRPAPGPWSDHELELTLLGLPHTIAADMTGLGPLGMALVLWVYPLALAKLPRWRGHRQHTGADTPVPPVVERPGLVPVTGLAGGAVALAGTFLARAYAQPREVLEKAPSLSTLVEWWVTASTWLGACLAAAVVAALVRERWLPRALTAAAIAQVVGFAGWMATVRFDGCLGSLSITSAGCGEQAGSVGGYAQLTVGAVLHSEYGAAITASLTAALGHGVSQLRKTADHAAANGADPIAKGDAQATDRETSPTTDATAKTASTVRPHQRIRFRSALATAGALLLVGSASVATGLALKSGDLQATEAGAPALPDTDQQGPDSKPPDAKNPELRERQELAWFTSVGADHAKRLGVFYREYRKLREAMDKPERATPGRPTAKDRADLKLLCTGLWVEGDMARRGYPYPITSVNRLWQRALGSTARAGRTCLDWLEQLPGSHIEAERALKLLDNGKTSTLHAFRQLRARLKAMEHHLPTDG